MKMLTKTENKYNYQKDFEIEKVKNKNQLNRRRWENGRNRKKLQFIPRRFYVFT